jgi:hypothetical protein
VTAHAARNARLGHLVKRMKGRSVTRMPLIKALRLCLLLPISF